MEGVAMVEPIQAASPVPSLDVTRIASLRKQLDHAATALKVIGFYSVLFVFGYALDFDFALGLFSLILALIVALLTPGCAFLIAKRLRSGRTWAVGLAAIWLVPIAVHLLPKALRAEFSFYGVLGAIMMLTPLYFLARGLIAFATYRARRRDDRTPPALALNPYEGGLEIKKRPSFINKKAITAYGLLILSPLPFLFVWLGLTRELKVLPTGPEAEAIGETVGYTVSTLYILFLLVLWGTRIYRRARRAAMLPGGTLMKKDTRPIVLYLRSFQDDSRIKLRARTANGRILPERLVKVSFEEVVTDHLWGYGPVVAIGDPRTKSKRVPLGAARDYVDDSIWQQKVIELMQNSAMIVVVAGGTAGLAWEIDTIKRLGSVWKLVLLLPPVGMQKLQARWQALAMHVGSNILPAQIDFVRARAVIFPKGRAALIVGKKGNDWTYEAALDEAALMIASERDAIHPTAPSPQRVSRGGRVRQVLGMLASELASMAAAALLLVLLAAIYMGNEYRKTVSRPYASPGSERESFIAEMMQVCRQDNPELSAEQLAKYCSCFANDLADSVTAAELTAITASDPSAFQAKVKSVANTCSEKTLGQ